MILGIQEKGRLSGGWQRESEDGLVMDEGAG